MESVGQMDVEIEIDIAEEDETWMPDDYGSCEEEACISTDRYYSHNVNMGKDDSHPFGAETDGYVEHPQVQLELDVKVEPVHTDLILPVNFSEPRTRFYSDIIQESCLGQNSHTRLGSNVCSSDFLEHGTSTTPRMQVEGDIKPETEFCSTTSVNFNFQKSELKDEPDANTSDCFTGQPQNLKSQEEEVCVKMEPADLKLEPPCQPEPGTEGNLDELTETNTQPPNIGNISGDVKCPSLRKTSVHDDDCKDDQVAQIDVSFQCSGSDSEVKGVASGKQHRCHKCGATFTRSGNLKQHLLVHKGLKPHKCLDCGAAFTQSGSLKRHLLIHKGIKPHKCVECGTSFTQSSHLKQHLLIHGGVKRCKCEDCGASFFHSNDLKKHQLIHKSEKRYACVECGARFAQSATLKRHLLSHKGLKTHKCIECGTSFVRSGHLRRHLLIHSGLKPHRCPECEASFTRFSDLKQHLLIHQGIKPHKCKECGLSFTQSSHLKGHLRIHTDKKQYKCRECGAGFTRPRFLRQHLFTHTSKIPPQAVKNSQTEDAAQSID